MEFDLNRDSSPLAARSYDVCVVGSGPAGLTVARELAAAGQSVALLEAGGLERTEASQAIYRGKETGLKTWNAIESCRLRYFGGTSNHWAGQCGVMQPSDFAAVRHHDLPGWPIEREELLAHLPQAMNILDLGTGDFNDKPIIAKKPSGFVSPALRFRPPARFATQYRKVIVESRRIDLFLNANLVNMGLEPQGNGLPWVSTVAVRNYAGAKVATKANLFVLAMGPIKIARGFNRLRRAQMTDAWFPAP